ncbi:MAG: chemotaxis protein CheW [Lysobacteraceae bacterium]|nr:MAG: chemotaxis protein CheW [Xanthomonadaceae bacterium]
MRNATEIIVFVIETQRFAVRLEQVVRAVAAVEVTPLPGAPAVVLGVFDLQGVMVPVYDASLRFGAASTPASVSSPVRASEQFLVLRTGRGLAALRVQQTLGVQPLDDLQALPAETQDAGPHWFDGVTRLADGLVLIHDIDHFLSSAEARQLGEALESM